MQQATAPEPYGVSIREGARLIGVGRTKMYELYHSGDIEFIKVGQRTIVLVASLRRYVQSRRATAMGRGQPVGNSATEGGT